ncbi:MAG: hypothetical protein J5606_09490 [Bacteroidales bacterium]|nr:hypothetical protein [Bacteroidales bacterium]
MKKVIFIIYTILLVSFSGCKEKVCLFDVAATNTLDKPITVTYKGNTHYFTHRTGFYKSIFPLYKKYKDVFYLYEDDYFTLTYEDSKGNIVDSRKINCNYNLLGNDPYTINLD